MKLAKDAAYFPVDEIIQQTEAMFVAQEKWTTRGALPSLPKESGDILSEKKIEKKSRKLRDIVQKNAVIDGIYYCAIYYTKDGDILGDMRENLPMMRLEKLESLDPQSISDSSPDFAWVMSLNTQFTENVTALKDKHQQSITNDFKKSFVQAVTGLKEQLSIQNISLGFLYDKCIKAKSQQHAFIVSVYEVADKNTFAINQQNFKWYSMYDFEHKMYQKYENFDYVAFLEKMDQHFSGDRWITAAIKYSQAPYPRLAPGFYVGHLRLAFSM